MRAVLNANIFASALMRPKGPPGQILASLLRDRAFELVLSPAIREEVSRALRYPKVRRRITASDEELDLWLAALDIIAVPVRGNLEVEVVADDPDDDKYLAAAVEGLAEVVVSGDDHLLALGRYEGIRIVTARAFAALLQRRAG